uniref:COBRA C-terminal domain-containing protein n=1 Tax=Kalanchoe fedtschenkoi TaxID=63787 RepID=A0A7N0SVM3_KALFE
MKVPWRGGGTFVACMALLVVSFLLLAATAAQDDGFREDQDGCNGIFLSYTFNSREKELPRVKNSTAQAWAFMSELFILNAGETELKEILVSADGAVVAGGSDFPVPVGNGPLFIGYPQADLKTSIQSDLAYSGSYLAQVTIDNINPLGRLDSWNLTWEWMRGEFIESMRGAYTRNKDYSECIYGAQGQHYKDLDFSQIMNCEKKPEPLALACHNKARSIFQLNVYKMPPDMNRTAINPPQHWQIDGIINPHYKCGQPIRVEFPDPSGLQATSYAVASWQVVCNITRPKPKQSKCCVSFSAFYNDSVVPPSEALLVPFDNRTDKAKAWGKLKNFKVPRTLPCPDNCGVSINWHVNSDYKSGWTARITLFNWEEINFEDWFAAIQINKAYPGYENVYSFNGTKLPQINNTIFMQGLKGLNYLMGVQQSVISFSKKHTHGINILEGDGFPTKVYFNGEECAIPVQIPTAGVYRGRRYT